MSDDKDDSRFVDAAGMFFVVITTKNIPAVHHTNELSSLSSDKASFDQAAHEVLVHSQNKSLDLSMGRVRKVNDDLLGLKNS